MKLRLYMCLNSSKKLILMNLSLWAELTENLDLYWKQSINEAQISLRL